MRVRQVMMDSRMLPETHQADLLYNKGAHYYWITSRTLKRTAMGKWFLGWSHTSTEGLILLLRSPSREEIAAAIAEGFTPKDEEEEEGPDSRGHALAEEGPEDEDAQGEPELGLLPQQGSLQQLLLQSGGSGGSGAAGPAALRGGGEPGARRAGGGGSGSRLAWMPTGEEDEAMSGQSGRRRGPPADPRLHASSSAAAPPAPAARRTAGEPPGGGRMGGSGSASGPASGLLSSFTDLPDGPAFAAGLSGGPDLLPGRSTQLGAAASIASNLPLGSRGDLASALSLLQSAGGGGSGGGGSAVARLPPMRLPDTVSELLPTEYLPAAVSVRFTVDGALQSEVLSCEVRRAKRGLRAALRADVCGCVPVCASLS
jgi:collagen type III alpha